MPDALNMASSGKKGKKSKGKTIPLNDFLQDGTVGGPAAPVRKTTLNWADEVEDSYDPYQSRNPKPAAVLLPTAPKAARGLDDYSDKIPQSPPYIAYLSNLPYDVEENEIADFFRNLTITNMKIPREDKSGEGSRVKGYGYVEFEDQESLIEALAKPSCMLKGRRIRIEVATNSDNDRRKGGRMDMNRDRGERPEAPTGDWRTGGRKEPDSDRRPAYRDGGYNRDRGEGMNRDRDTTNERPGAWRDATDRPVYNNDRYERSDRGGMNRDVDRGGMNRDGMDRGGMSRDGMERGGMNRDGMSRDNRYDDRRGPRRYDREENGGSGGGFSKRDDEPRTRPKLKLAPRTVPIENPPPETKEGAEQEQPPPKPTPVPAASIFGAAKPVDTAAKERQIEERLAKQTLDVDSRRDDDRRRDGKRSPDRRRYSPRRSPNFRRDSPDRRISPDRRRSPNRRRSPDNRRDYSPDNRRRDYSNDRGRNSPDRRSDSPEPRRNSSDRRQYSPDGGRRSSPPRKRYDEKRGPPKQDRDRKPREYTEKDMPKLKTPEPIKITTANKYAFLGEQDDSDSDEK